MPEGKIHLYTKHSKISLKHTWRGCGIGMYQEVVQPKHQPIYAEFPTKFKLCMCMHKRRREVSWNISAFLLLLTRVVSHFHFLLSWFFINNGDFKREQATAHFSHKT